MSINKFLPCFLTQLMYLWGNFGNIIFYRGVAICTLWTNLQLLGRQVVLSREVQPSLASSYKRRLEIKLKEIMQDNDHPLSVILHNAVIPEVAEWDYLTRALIVTTPLSSHNVLNTIIIFSNTEACLVGPYCFILLLFLGSSILLFQVC